MCSCMEEGDEFRFLLEEEGDEFGFLLEEGEEVGAMVVVVVKRGWWMRRSLVGELHAHEAEGG